MIIELTVIKLKHMLICPVDRSSRRSCYMLLYHWLQLLRYNARSVSTEELFVVITKKLGPNLTID